MSATSVTLGFEVLDNLGAASAAAGIANSNQFGNGTDQVNAIVNYLNSHGGLYGRKVVAAVEHYDATSQDSTQSDQICTKFTEDDHAFAVVLTTVDSDTDSIMQCYAQHQTMIFNDYEYSDGFYRALWPYAWNADQPSQDVMSATLIDGLKSRGFFTGKLGILSVDEPEDRDAVNNVILPRLQSLGFTNYTVQYVTYNTQGQVVQQIGAAELSFSQSGVDHVIFPGDIGGGLAGYFMIAASQQKYYPWYGLDSDNQPAQAVASGSIPLDEYAKMLGVGMAEIYDVNDAQGDKFPNAREKRCADVMAAAGITFPIRDDATTALTYCDFAFAIHDVTQAAGGTLSAAAFGAAAPRSGYASAIPYTTQFGSQRPWGAASYRETKFDTGCSCLVYVSGVFQAPSS